MAHAFARRSGGTADKTSNRLFELALDVISRFFFSRTTDLTDHDHAVRVLVAIISFEDVYEVGAIDRITANADASRLTDAELSQLENGFVGERARARNDADVAHFMNLPRHDADLTLAGSD